MATGGFRKRLGAAVAAAVPTGVARACVTMSVAAAVLILMPSVAFAQPSGLGGVSGPGDVLLTWSDSSAATSHYLVYRSLISGGAKVRVGKTYTKYFRDSSGTVGATYYYTVVSADSSGHESAPSNEVSASAAAFAQDAFEADDTAAVAGLLAGNGTPQDHNFHNDHDEDWLTFTPTEDRLLVLKTEHLGVEADTVVYLYDQQGLDNPSESGVPLPLVSDDDGGGGNFASKIVFPVAHDAAYFVRVVNARGDHGRTTNYEVVATLYATDTESPTVVSLVPSGPAIPRRVTLGATVDDAFGVDRVEFEYSLDGGNEWLAVNTVVAGTPGQRQFESTWEPGGSGVGVPPVPHDTAVKVRAMVIDGAGNRGDGTPVASYVTDYETPTAPASLAFSFDGPVVNLSWTASSAGDVDHYVVYRSGRANGPYFRRAVAAGRGYSDRNDLLEAQYYRVTAVDGAGNEGGPVQGLADQVVPGLLGVYPRPGAKLQGGHPRFDAFWWDNVGMAGAQMMYSAAGGGWTSTTVSASGTAFLSSTADGPLHVKFDLLDLGGNHTVSPTLSYVVDNIPPETPTALTAAPLPGAVSLTWTASPSPDTRYYRILESTAQGSGYRYTDRASAPGYIHAQPSTTAYFYRVEAVDDVGNRSAPSSEASAAAQVFTFDADDAYEDDDWASEAKWISVGAAPQPRNSVDSDWVKFAVDSTRTIVMGAPYRRTIGHPGISVYRDYRGELELLNAWPQTQAIMEWTPPGAGVYYLDVSHASPWGQYDTLYDLTLSHSTSGIFEIIEPAPDRRLGGTESLRLLPALDYELTGVKMTVYNALGTFVMDGDLVPDGRWWWLDWDTSELPSGKYRVDVATDNWGAPVSEGPAFAWITSTTSMTYAVEHSLAPEPPLLEQVTTSGPTTSLRWRSRSEGIAYYGVHRSSSSPYGPWYYAGGTANQTMTAAAPSEGDGFYRVVAYYANGLQGRPSNVVSGNELVQGVPKVVSFDPPDSTIIRGGKSLRVVADEPVSALFQYSTDDGVSWTDIAGSTALSTSPEVWWNAGGLQSGVYDVRALVTNFWGSTSSGHPERTYTVDNAVAPTILGLDPDSGSTETTVTITGSGFGAPSAWNVVLFGEVEAPVISWSDTGVVVSVPYGAVSGNVRVRREDTYSNGGWFDVISAPGIIGSFKLDWGATYALTTAVTGYSDVTGAEGMRFKTGDAWGDWLPFTSTTSLTLPAVQGTRTVYAEYRDSGGLTTRLSDSIVLDTVGPTGTFVLADGAPLIEAATVGTTTNVPDAKWVRFKIELANSHKGWIIKPWGAFSGWWDYWPWFDLVVPLQSGISFDIVTVTAQFADEAGNVSEPLVDTIEYDSRIPATSMRATASKSVAPYGGAVTVTATLTDAANQVVAYRTDVTVHRSIDGGATWTAEDTAAYNATPQRYVKTVGNLTHNTLIEFRFPGDLYFGPSTARVSVKAYAKLSTPVAPSVVKVNKLFTVYGYLWPRHGGSTKLTFYRKSGKKYVSYKSYSAPNSNYSTYTKYSKGFKLPYKTSWYVQASHSDTNHVKTLSAKKYFTVK